MKLGCIFCEIPQERIVLENDYAYAIRDAYPVTRFHTLVIPKRHTIDYFSLVSQEFVDCSELLLKLRLQLQSADPSIKGFNIGMNCGKTAGQTVFHCHIHLIPRREGDLFNPTGGVRNVIPGKGDY